MRVTDVGPIFPLHGSLHFNERMKSSIIQVVCVVLEDAKRRLFIARRSPDRSLGGYWEFPGGKVRDGELPREALKREIKEELEVSIEVGDELPSNSHVYEFGTVVLIPFRGHILTGEMVLKDHDRSVWIERELLKSLKLAPADIPIASYLENDCHEESADDHQPESSSHQSTTL